jgi:phenylpropionate dioxygenase-like ring-hydroxylating dioxygenase large terminal subunit
MFAVHHDRDVDLVDPVLRHNWHVVGYSKHLPNNGLLGARVLGISLVLFRVDDQITVAKNLCMHRGSSFYDLYGDRFRAEVVDGCLVCPYHHWRYDRTGQCVHIPALDNGHSPPQHFQLVGNYHVCERYGWIWVALDKPDSEVPEFPQYGLDGFRLIPSGPYFQRTPGPRFAENFLDVAHLSQLHAGYLGVQEQGCVNNYHVFRTSDGGLHAANIDTFQPNPDGSGKSGKVRYNFWVMKPLTLRLVKVDVDDPHRIFALYCHITPHDAATSSVYMCMALNTGHNVPAAEIAAFQDMIAQEQDIPIVECQRPETLPYNFAEELHLRADHASIEYRKWLRELGVTFGVA